MRWRKTRRLLSIILLAFLVSIIGNTVYAEGDTITVGVPVTYGQTEARSMLSLVNDFRTGDEAWEWNSDDTTKTVHTDLNELAYDYDLEKVAMKRAAEIAIFFSHTRPNKADCWTAYTEAGLTGYNAVAENIAAGYTTAESVFEGWKETNDNYSGQGHRRNMLSSRVTAIGIGHVVYKGVHYWVQEFRSPTGNTTETPANDTSDTVQVEVSKSTIENSSVQADVEALTIPCGESVNTPTITSKILLTDTWPYSLSPVILSYDWAIEDSQIAEISNEKLTGLKVGTTNLTTSVSLDQTYTITVPVTVEGVSISNAQINLSTDSYIYDGSEHQPAITTVTLNGKTLVNDQDYTVSYRNNVNAGTGSVIITGTGNYTGTAEKSFSITAKDISEVTVKDIPDQTYTGANLTPSVTVEDGSITLQSGTDYTVSYSNNTNAGTASVTITGKGNYGGTSTKEFTILQKNLEGADITGISDKTYTGEAIKQNPVVKDGTTLLSENADYTISYENNTNAGTAKIIITGTRNYTGSVENTFSITPKSISEVTITEIEDKVYTGSSITQSLTLKNGNIILVEKDDYTIEYNNNVNAGTASVIITGKGNYTSTAEKSFSITAKDISEVTVKDIPDQTYTGANLTPSVTVEDGASTLRADTDYTVSYSNNTNAGTASVTIAGKGNYGGTSTKEFTILPKNLEGADITGISDKTYTGEAITQNPVVKDGTTLLSENADYIISYENNINAGKAKIIITGTRNYTSSIEGTFSIAPKLINEVTIIGIEDKVYTSQEITQELTVKDGEKLLSEDKDYTVEYLNNLNIGTATIKISGKGNYRDYIEKTFNIGKNLKDCNISELDTYTYTGEAIRPTIIVSDGTLLLSEDKDYSIIYKNNTNAGTASVIITGKGSYVGTVEKSFTILKQDQVITAASYSKTYGSKPFVLNAKATGKLSYRSSNNSIATVSDTGNVTLKSPGKVTITISAAATENYNEATKQITITISPKKVAGLSVKAGKKKLTVNWKKDSKVTGYQITYAQNSKFTKGVKNITISKNSTIKKEIKSLKSKKTYYVKIRSYKTVGKTKIYSTYSTVKKVKVK
ncbi:MAG: CAP domain-containing protein [Lachnospiraceae bacterium]